MACTQQMLNRQGAARAAPFTPVSPRITSLRIRPRQPLSIRASSSSGLAADAAAPIQKLKEACRTKQVRQHAQETPYCNLNEKWDSASVQTRRFRVLEHLPCPLLPELPNALATFFCS